MRYEIKFNLKNIDGIKINIIYLVQKKSNLIIDGLEMTDKVLNVKNLLYGNKYGKSSK